MTKKPWSDFTDLKSKSFVHAAQHVSPDDLYDMEHYRKAERMKTCGGVDPIHVVVVYAQDEMTYADGEKVNRFGLAYKRDAKLWLHKTLADITIDAVITLYQTQGWTTTLYDGLRTVDGAYKLYLAASDEAMSSGLLSLPGRSSHNKAMAIDSMMSDSSGQEVDVGGHFDHPNMEMNSRAYAGDKISEAAKKNRLIRESAFMRAALLRGYLLAPLRSEFWHDQTPENREDLWRVLDSTARCMGIRLLTEEDEKLRKENRAAFCAKWETWNYQDFLGKWKEIFRGREAELKKILGVELPPAQEKSEFYHGNYHPIYDEQLKASGKNIT